MSTYNVTRLTRQVLKRYRKQPPSLVLHLYAQHFRFEHQHGNFAYDSPMRCFLEAIREQRLPTDLLDVLDQAGVRYYEGCLIVEVHDHRTAATSAPAASSSSPATAAPSGGTMTPGAGRFSFQLSLHARDNAAQVSRAEVYRIVLYPTSETLWHELGRMDRTNAASTWSEEDAVEQEARILARTAPPLCLDPSVQVTRIANTMLRATTLRPPSTKRRRGAADGDDLDDDAARARAEDPAEVERREREARLRMMKIGDDGIGRAKTHAFARLALIHAIRDKQSKPALAQAAPPTQAAAVATTSQQQDDEVKKPRKKKQRPSAVSTGGGDSDASASTTSAIAPKKPSKKAQAAAAAHGIALPETATQMTPEEEEKARLAAERKRMQASQRRAEAKARKEKKRQAEAAAAATASGGDLSVNESVHGQIPIQFGT